MMMRIQLALMVALCAAVSQAQTTTGSLIGSALDESGAAVTGVQIRIESPALPGGPQVTTTNERGEYRFTRLPPGTYALKMERPGFATYVETDLRVLAGGTTERIVQVKVAAVSESVTVSGRAP